MATFGRCFDRRSARSAQLFRFLALGGLSLSLGSCKPGQSGARAQDFALSATAANFAVVAGSDRDDVNNFSQIFANELMGKFQVSGSVGAQVADIKSALGSIGTKLQPDST